MSNMSNIGIFLTNWSYILAQRPDMSHVFNIKITV